jgi:2-dehydropantoate 2-reductase
VRALVVGAGAAGGYLGAQLVTGGRDVTFLVHQSSFDRLTRHGLRIRRGSGTSALPVTAITAAQLEGHYGVVVLAVRSDVVESAVDDFRSAVTPDTRIVPLVNGIAHLSVLTAAFGEQAVLGAAVRLATSMLTDGIIDEVAPGVDLELGQLDGRTSPAFDAVVQTFRVDNIAVRVRSDMVAGMWEKFTFIGATAALTCLAGDVIGVVARTPGGPALGRRVAAEVAAVAAAEGYPLSPAARAKLDTTLTDPTSRFAPSMFRDLAAHRRVEISVLSELAESGRRHHIDTPLLDAAQVVIEVGASEDSQPGRIRER